jgi:hypothetical protein
MFSNICTAANLSYMSWLPNLDLLIMIKVVVTSCYSVLTQLNLDSIVCYKHM